MVRKWPKGFDCEKVEMARSMRSLTSVRWIPTSGPATATATGITAAASTAPSTRSGRPVSSHSRSTTKNMSTAVPRRASSAALCPGA